MRRLVVLLAAVLTTALAGACGGTGDSPLAVLAAAPEAAQEAGSARFEMDVATSSESLPGGEMSMSGSGAADFPDRMHMTMEMSGGPQLSGDIEMALDGSIMYMRMSMLEQMLPEGKPWVRIDLETFGEEMGVDISQLLQSGQGDPTAWLESLRGASGDIEELGRERIRGVQTTHYRVVVDTDKALEQLEDDEAREQLQTLLEQSGVPDTYPMEVWIGDDELARRMTFELETNPDGMGTMQQTTTMELFDYGADVDIPVPSEDETVDIEQLMDRAGGSA